MSIVVPLRQRAARTALPALTAAVVLGVPIAAVSLAVTLGAGVEPIPGRAWLMVAITALAVLPIPLLVRRWRNLRPRARLVIDDDHLTITFPESLRAPLIVPRSAVRLVAVDDTGRDRFRIHIESGPYGGGSADGFLWRRGFSALPTLTPGRTPPNVLLLFDPPVAGADPRLVGVRGVFRGEHMAGLLLAARDARQADRALDALGVTRPITMPDLITMEAHLQAPASGRFELGLMTYTRLAWVLIALGVIVPLLAAIGAAFGIHAFNRERRAEGTALALAGLGVVAVRLTLWL